MTLKTLAAAACISLAAASAGSAATFNLVGGFSGGQLGHVAFDVTIDNDFTANVFDTSSGLTINSLTSSKFNGPISAISEIVYTYVSNTDALLFGGSSSGAWGVDETETDFAVLISGLVNGPPMQNVLTDSLSSRSGVSRYTVAPLSVTEVSAVPLPAGGLLLLTGIGGVAAFNRRKKRAA